MLTYIKNLFLSPSSQHSSKTEVKKFAKSLNKKKNTSSSLPNPLIPSSLSPLPPSSNSEKGFSLIDSLISTALIGIGFVGIYSLVVLSEKLTHWAIARQKLQLTANQILDVIDGDKTNIDNYNLTLTTCTDPGITTTIYLLRSFEWCTRMSAEVGAAGTTNTRSITITTPAAGQRNVLIRLDAYDGKAQIIMERTYVL